MQSTEPFISRWAKSIAQRCLSIFKSQVLRKLIGAKTVSFSKFIFIFISKIYQKSDPGRFFSFIDSD